MSADEHHYGHLDAEAVVLAYRAVVGKMALVENDAALAQAQRILDRLKLRWAELYDGDPDDLDEIARGG